MKNIEVFILTKLDFEILFSRFNTRARALGGITARAPL